MLPLRPSSRFLSGGRFLLLPVVALLFLQWPLRDIFRAWSREANDLGQWLFALYVAICITAATREHTHLAADALARHYPERVRVASAEPATDPTAIPATMIARVAAKA